MQEILAHLPGRDLEQRTVLGVVNANTKKRRVGTLRGQNGNGSDQSDCRSRNELRQ